jgi:hypothetical protein
VQASIISNLQIYRSAIRRKPQAPVALELGAMRCSSRLGQGGTRLPRDKSGSPQSVPALGKQISATLRENVQSYRSRAAQAAALDSEIKPGLVFGWRNLVLVQHRRIGRSIRMRPST